MAAPQESASTVCAQANCCGTEGRTRSELIRLDEEEPETIEQHRSEERGADTQA